jgi:hypothetical protein
VEKLKMFHIYIEYRDGSLTRKIYWNAILGDWVACANNSTRYTEKEAHGLVKKGTDSILLGSIKMEKIS